MEYTVSATACLPSHEGFLESCGLLLWLFATVLPSFFFVFSLDLMSSFRFLWGQLKTQEKVKIVIQQNIL